MALCFHLLSCSTLPTCKQTFLAEKNNALVISSGNQVSHILPIVNGKLDARSCKRFVSLHLTACPHSKSQNQSLDVKTIDNSSKCISTAKKIVVQ